MAQLIVRNLEDEVVRRLKRRAGEHGVSVEEEHRKILREALAAREPMGFKEFLKTMPVGSDELVFERDRSDLGRATEENLFEE
ncbi:MAG: DNA-binding protein [Verrucomicrobiota bacterium]